MTLQELAWYGAIFNGLFIQPVWMIWVLYNHYKSDHKGEENEETQS
jgi:hypothetical protein